MVLEEKPKSKRNSLDGRPDLIVPMGDIEVKYEILPQLVKDCVLESMLPDHDQTGRNIYLG